MTSNPPSPEERLSLCLESPSIFFHYADTVEDIRSLLTTLASLRAREGTARDELRESLKHAFVAGCCAVLTWTNSGMPQDDLDEAGYDYAAAALEGDGT